MSQEEVSEILYYLKKLAPVGWQEQERLYQLVARLEKRLRHRELVA